MQSFLIISRNDTKRLEYAQSICDKQEVHVFDTTIIDLATSIGIEDIRNIQKTLYLTPHFGPEKALIIQHAQTATIEAQNAMLKILEEPPIATTILLLADSQNAFLPTIISRCKVIMLTDTRVDKDEQEQQVILDEFIKLTTFSIDQRFVKAQQIAADKEKAPEWIRDMMHVTRHQMLANPTNTIVFEQLEHLQHFYTLATTTNVNLRFLLEILLLLL